LEDQKCLSDNDQQCDVSPSELQIFL